MFLELISTEIKLKGPPPLIFQEIATCSDASELAKQLWSPYSAHDG